MTKGLVSVVAASMLSTVAFAGSSITTPSTYSKGAGNLDSYTAPKRNVSIAIQELGVAGFAASGYFTLKLNTNTALGDDNSSSELTGGAITQSLLGTSSSPLNILETNQTTTDVLFLDLNGTLTPSIISNVTYDANGTSGTLHHHPAYLAGGSATGVGYVRAAKYSTLGDTNTTSDGNTTVGKLYYDSATGETVITLAVTTLTTTIEQIAFDLNLSVDANSTGVMSISVIDGDANGANGVGVTAATIKLYDVINQPATITYNAAKTAPNVTIGDNQPMLDFNVTLAAPWNETNAIRSASKVKVKLNNSVWSSDANVSDSNITTGSGAAYVATASNLNHSTLDQNISLTTTTTTLDTLEVNLSRSDSNVSVQFVGDSLSGALLLNTTGKSVGDVVTATVTGTGKLAHMSLTTATLGTVTTDGVSVVVGDGNTSGYTGKLIVPGRTEQRLIDLNISETFSSSFATTSGANKITVTLPTGYTFSSAPMARIYTQGSATVNDENNLTAALSSNVATIQFATTGGDIDLTTSTSLKEVVQLSLMKVSVPSTAVDAEIVPVTLAGSMFTSAKTLNVSTINVATVETSVASVTELNTTIGTVATSSQSSVKDGFVAFDINESFAAQLTAGTTISLTLSDGAFSALNGTCTVGANDVGMVVSDCAESDNNKTITYTISTASVSANAGVRIVVPAVNLASVSTEKTITATIGGTAGVTGSINIVKTAFGTKTISNSIASAARGAVDSKTGELLITEGISNGLTANATFKIIAPVGISFTGDYVAVNKTPTSATDTTTTYATSYPSTDSTDTNVSTTFNTNDTLTMSINSSWVGSFVDSVKIKPEVNVNSATAVNGVQEFQVKDVTGSGIISTTGLKLLYVGTIPTLTAAAAATVEPGKTVSVVPTNATGTVTYASADTAIATVDTAGTVTVDANATTAATVVITATDSLTAQAASTTITVGTAAPVLLSGDITLAAGWNFVSAPFDGSIDIATIVAAGCSQVHLVDTTTGFWGAAATTGTAVPGQGVAAYCAAAGTASYTGVTAATTPFSMATNITGTGSTAVPSTHAAYAVGANFKVVGTPTATTFADVITAGATGVMYYNGTAFDLSSDYTSAGFAGVADNAAQTIPAGASFYIQTN